MTHEAASHQNDDSRRIQCTHLSQTCRLVNSFHLIFIVNFHFQFTIFQFSFSIYNTTTASHQCVSVHQSPDRVGLS